MLPLNFRVCGISQQKTSRVNTLSREEKTPGCYEQYTIHNLHATVRPSAPVFGSFHAIASGEEFGEELLSGLGGGAFIGIGFMIYRFFKVSQEIESQIDDIPE